MLKLKWLRVNKFRSVRPGTLLTFSPRYNVLLGQNGTGKTTLLNLVSAAVRSDFSEFEKEEFDIEYELASHEASAHASVRNAHQSDPVQQAIESIPGGILTAAGLSLGHARKYIFTSKFKLISALCADPIKTTYSENSNITTELQSQTYNRTWPPSLLLSSEHALVGLLELRNRGHINQELFSEFAFLLTYRRNRRFDESFKYLEHIQTTRYMFQRTPNTPISNDPEFLDTPEALQLIKENWGRQHYMFSQQQMPFLDKLSHLLAFERIDAALELHEASTRENEESLVLNGLRFFFHANGELIIDEKLSYGQKRMLAFLYYSSLARDIVIADELVNGLHHQWIRACIEEIGERQAFLTSQNPILLDYLTFDSPEQVRSTFILCGRDTQSNQLTWQGMSQEAAEDFYDSYKVGFQHVGELLQTKGLW